MAIINGTDRLHEPYNSPIVGELDSVEKIITTMGIWARGFNLNIDHISPVCRTFNSFKDLTTSIKEWSNYLMNCLVSNKVIRPSIKKPFNRNLYDYLRRACYNPSNTQRCMIISLLMVKKGFPEAPKCLVDETLKDHQELLSSPSERTDEKTVDDILEIVDKLFPYGWDLNKGICGPLPTKAVYEGGVATQYVFPEEACSLIQQAKLTYDRFLHMRKHFKVKAVAVQQPGKIRVITKSEYSLKCLMPLQNALMDQLRNNPSFCLTRKECEENDFDIFLEEKGAFVSGDYKSATDNLNLDLQYYIMQRILFNSVTPWVKSLWMVALREVSSHKIEYEKLQSIDQVRGQLMGSLLSFPLLCIINYSIFHILFPNKKVLINGDDILFRASQQEYDLWKVKVLSVGLQLSIGKNYFSNEIFTINSKFYRWQDRANEIGYLHLGHLLGPMSGDSYRRIPQRFQGMYKRYCQKPFENLRDLLEPTCFGGLGGLTLDEYNKTVPVRRPSALAIHHQMKTQEVIKLGSLAGDVLDFMSFKFMTWIYPSCRREDIPQRTRIRTKGKLGPLYEPRMIERTGNFMTFIGY
ncbi:RNA-dependent RNA polymerase [Wenling narna-like virus 4]|uniref:RNA-dependent RNA polymerase n=1 Tax=Wenling narna-like virus 4 TaxID=1923504 RepID=UPI00090A4421|nr:RNA-dependent RNA polymerase [Wenling narna-like virus 4]APG77256.1 RNA-dependent RNA polymerase [Wenling narna-like virus 4]